jgi:hypothetical protein
MILAALLFASVLAYPPMVGSTGNAATTPEAACTRPPYFDITGEVCGTYHSPSDPCGCSEAISWDPIVPPEWAAPGTCVYEVQRTSPAGTVTQQGRRLTETCVGMDENDETCIIWMPTPWWLPAWDTNPFPHLDKVYLYQVRACCCEGTLDRVTKLCNGVETCSVGWSLPIAYQRGEWWDCTPAGCVVHLP